ADARSRRRGDECLRSHRLSCEERDRTRAAQDRVQGEGRDPRPAGPGAARSEEDRDRGHQGRIREDTNGPEGPRVLHQVPIAGRPLGPRRRGRVPPAGRGVKRLTVHSPGRCGGTFVATMATNGGRWTMGAVGVRELKNRLTHYLRRARKGEEVIVTERGRPV